LIHLEPNAVAIVKVLLSYGLFWHLKILKEKMLSCKVILMSPKPTRSLKITMSIQKVFIPKVFSMAAELLSASGDRLGMSCMFGS